MIAFGLRLDLKCNENGFCVLYSMNVLILWECGFSLGCSSLFELCTIVVHTYISTRGVQYRVSNLLPT